MIPEICLILVKEGEILLLRRKNTGWSDGWYCTPAGHGEEGETMREATAREAKEEVGITINPADLEFVHVQHRWSEDLGGHSRIGFYFVAHAYDGEIVNMEPDKCDDVQFFPLSDLPPNTIAPFKLAIECYTKGVTYSEFGWDKKI